MVTAVISAATFLLGTFLGALVSAALQKRGEKESRVWEARRAAYARLTAGLLTWQPALPSIEEVKAGAKKTQHVSLEEVLAQFSEALLVAETPMAGLLVRFAHIGSRLDAANEEFYESLSSMPPAKLAAYTSDQLAFTESNEWKEMQALERQLLDAKFELLNCMRYELGAAKGRSFSWKPEHFTDKHE